MTAVFKKIWQLLIENDFKDQIPQKYHCLICKDVAILANSTICGCIFCDECITNYMKDGMNKCPGKGKECTEEPLVLNQTFSRDTAIWVYMSKIIVKCPYGTCEEMCAIENMTDHVQDCAMITVKCPYEKVGCKGEHSNEHLKNHYDKKKVTHSQMMMKAFDDLRNELLEIVNKKDEEIMKLKEDSARKETMIVEMNEKRNEDLQIILEDLKTKGTAIMEINQRMNDNDERRKEDLHIIMEDLKIKESLIIEIKQHADDQRREIEKLKDKDERRDREMKVMKETQKTIMEELKNVKKDLVERDFNKNVKLEEQLTTMNQEIKDIKEQSIAIKDSVETIKEDFIARDDRTKKNVTQSVEESKTRDDSLTERIDTIYLQTNVIAGEKLFRVERFSESTFGECIHSPYFYSNFNSYKLRLEVYPRAWGESLEVYFLICKGENDDELPWPCNFSIMVSIVNEREGLDRWRESIFNHSSAADKGPFETPKNKDGSYCGGPLKVPLGDLRRVFLNNVVLIRARVSAFP